ncbi:MAG: hypothetical protein JJ913_08105 [Rhizobiaceae bacterium]|nr:hypothetical protein [Rhizobiaceae bacterium]
MAEVKPRPRIFLLKSGGIALDSEDGETRIAVKLMPREMRLLARLLVKKATEVDALQPHRIGADVDA